MKACELMIADWILYRGKPRQVRYINDRISHCGRFHNDEIGFTHREEEWINVCHADYLPLTIDILKVNGFEFDEDGILVLTMPIEDMMLKTLIKIGASDSIWDEEKICFNANIDSFPNSVDVHVFYVHELQRALRCCGLNELANNLKIE